MRARLSFLLCTCWILALLAPAPSLAEDVEEERSRFLSFEGANQDGKKIFDFEVMREIREQLRDTADVVIVAISACRSGGFVNVAPGWLTGDFSVSASRKMKSNVRVEWHEENWYSEHEKKAGKTGIKINDTEYAHGWFPQVFRAIKLDGTRTAKGIADFAKENDYEGPNGAQYVSGGAGAGAKLRPATGKSRAIYWHTACKNNDLIKTDHNTLVDAGFTHQQIELAYNDGANDIGVPVERVASRDELLGANGMIRWLRDELSGGAGPKHAVIFLSSRKGAVEKAKVPKAPNAVTGQRKQGRVITPADAVVPVSSDDEFRQAFFSDRSDTAEVGVNPSVTLTTSEESYAGPVGVEIDGVSIGSFDMLGSSQGGSYELVVSDGVWAALDAAHILDDGEAGIHFLFPSGSFRVATEWDFELDQLPHYGVGLCTAFVGRETAGEVVPLAAWPAVAAIALATLLAGAVALRSRGRAGA